jgi:arginine deiminase
MHTPGEELDLVTPTTYQKFLFEDAVDANEFRRQHEGFVKVLRSEGVEVVLLGEVLENRAVENSIRKCPNLVYTRDTVSISPAGFVKMRMKNVARRKEPDVVEEALRLLGVRKLVSIERPATMEGGDLVFLDEDTLLLGVGNRTNRAGLRKLCRTAMKEGLRTLVAVQLPPWIIHLDGTMMVVDRDLAILHPQSHTKPALMFTQEKVIKCRNLRALLKKRGMQLVEVTTYERQKRATNVVTLGPRKVVGYSGNARVKRELVRAGVVFIEIDGSELVRGGGGPRCMTAPIERN